MKKLLVFAFVFCLSLSADVFQNEQVYAAANVVKSFGCDNNNTVSEKYLENVKAVAIIPDVTRTSAIASTQKGKGVFSMRDLNGNWTPPIMITYSSFGAGPQVGIESADMILLFQTSKSFRDIFKGQDLLGLNAGGTIGEGSMAGRTTDLPEVSAYIVKTGKTSGVYFGASLDFGRIVIDDQATNDYYERIYDYQDILNGSPRDSKYTKMLKHALNVYLANDREKFRCDIDKFIVK
ncbi:lipid-binding SYLF domain-containing protein [Campylobacter ureolyticus]|uniref:lipid-binding SYLF domain-containing protein n=1 Tax=Campylobacter ureolyticus TaxID=827 RepID=UPI00288B2415|nr:lipid-binding SYLF domain-containing protein [Campylobacter ureolyticus]